MRYDYTMKLLLCSEVFRTPNTVKACVELVNKPQDQIKIAVINEAYAGEDGDKHWVVDNLNDIASNFNADMHLVNLLALSLDKVEAAINECDAVVVIGGNTDYLMYVFQKTGFATLLPKLLETKVYVGSSAGSQIIGHRVSTKAYRDLYGAHNTFGVTEYLQLLDLAIKPHINSSEQPHATPDRLIEAVGNVPYPVYGLQDDSALIIDGEILSFTGSSPIKIVNGKRLKSLAL